MSALTGTGPSAGAESPRSRSLGSGGGDRDRGRVPFALVAVVLLLGSVAYANSLALGGPVVVDTAVDDALDRMESVGRPAVRAAATGAAHEAALDPVTTPANTTVGRALDPNRSFRDALRLRISLATAEALADATTDAGGVTATASLPAVESIASPADARAAVERVSVASLANGTALRVTVRNVTLTAMRGGETVATRRVNYTVSVAVPVLAMHDQTAAYEARLNRSPVDGPGLGRALTWRLWSVAQARGTAQYLGAPISNVLAARHVELSTNAAALRAQRAVYGRGDPAGRAALLTATARVGARDLLAPAMARGPAWTERVLADARNVMRPVDRPATTTGTTTTTLDGASRTGGDGGRSFRVGVNASADRAFVAFLDHRSDGGFDAAVRGAYRSRATRRVRVVGVTLAQRPPRSPPGPNWTLLSERLDERVVVVEHESIGGPTADRRDRVAADERRTVAVRNRVTRRWVGNGSIRTTTARWTDRYRVRITLTVEYDPSTGPDRPTAPRFVRGGAVDGLNLADVPAAARADLLPPGATDRAARAAVRPRASGVRLGHETVDRTTVYGDRPPELDDWIYRDLIGVRERVRNVSVPVVRSAVAAGEANAAARLAAVVRERRESIVDAPATYDGAADRARVAARAAYVDSVIAELDARAGGSAARNDAYRDRIDELRAGADDRIDDLARIASEATAPRPASAGRWRAGEVVLTPHGVPGYLPVTAVGSRRIDSLAPGETVRPLVARNTNLFAVPTGDAADAVTDATLPARRTASLAAAGRALVATNRTAVAAGAGGEPSTSLASARATLRRRVAAELRVVDSRVCSVLERRTDLSRRDRLAVLRTARRRWPAAGARTAAVVDGSYAAAIARAAVGEGGAGSAIDRDRLAVRLRVELAAAVTDSRVTVPSGVRAGVVDETRAARRAELRSAVRRAGANATEALYRRYGAGKLGPVLAGLPVAPVPGYWYATVNVWDVEVAGAYPQFEVSAPAGAPDGADATVRYIRDGARVTLDVDSDGTAELLGRSDRVAFRTWTVVVVVVPAGTSGVGDIDGNADERSAGWPCPSVPDASGRAVDAGAPTCLSGGGE
ncbi:DUF7286 family protein [Halobaculum gomorrense]|uniref:DUF7286 family protein n=1 Tax=Halobaculum gomorrense TaxID=43928 RepID=UPI001161523C|nr:hypothetical protein [Halobaculum gomorrense]